MNYDVLSMQEHRPLMIDLSLVLNTIAVVLVVISITFEIPKELREGVASTLLTKPLGRTQYLIGKALGTIVTGLIISLIITAGFFIIFNFAFSEKGAVAIFQAHLLVAASIIPMAAMAVFFSVLVPEMVTPIITAIAIWFAFSTKVLSNVPILYAGVLPDLDLYNLKAFAVYGDKLSWGYIGLAIIWGILFSAFALSLASLIFRYKDIK
jgi:ABC-type transport system involved in multi-copper enzyme maturation permease subunit